MRERVRVAQVIDRLDRGGAERVLIDIANTLDRERFDVHVVTTRAPGGLAGQLAEDVRLQSLNRRTRADVDAVRRLGTLLREGRMEVVHTHSHTAAYLVRAARHLSRAQWLHIVHDHHGPVEHDWRLRLLDRLLLGEVDYYFAVSTSLLAYGKRWMRVAASRAELLTNGVRVSGPCERSWPKRFTIVQVARFHPVKQQMLALAAAAALRERIPNFRWLFVGRADTPYGMACQREAKRLGLEHHVEFLGVRDDVAVLLRDASVGVLTSRSEGLPLAMLEYMAAPLPVVVTPVGECGRLVRASGGGSVAGCDAGAIAGALARFEDPSEAAKAAAANHAFVRVHYSTPAMVRRIEAVYETLVGKGESAPVASGVPRAPLTWPRMAATPADSRLDRTPADP